MRQLPPAIIIRRWLMLLIAGMAGSMLAMSVRAQEQTGSTLMTGQVSFTTSQNIYARFVNASLIKPGDTIFLKSNTGLTPAFLVEQVSSVSCVGKPLPGMLLKAGDEVVVRVAAPMETENIARDTLARSDNPEELRPATPDTIRPLPWKSRKQDIHGSLGVFSYTNLSNTLTDDTQRMRYSLSLRANNLSGSRLSAESYLTFTHRFGEWDQVRENPFQALKIYSLAIKYDLTDHTNIWAGRRINSNLSNIGAVDGLQVESAIGKFTLGAVAGSRPNDSDYSFNPKLLEYGGFAGYGLTGKNGRMQSSLAFFEQRNTGITDRRFAYFQHDNSLLKKLHLFTSAELDLYRVEEGVAKNQPTLTSLYFSIRYKVFKKLSLFASYDARRNVIYYETYKSFADRLLEEATRQGLQVRVNYQPGNRISMGANGGYRYRSDDNHPTRNLSGYFTVTQIPGIKATATLTANLLQTSYVDGKIFGIRMTKDIIPGKFYTEWNYRFVDYRFMQAESAMLQHIAQGNLSWQLKKKFSLSIDYELTFEGDIRYHRMYASFSKRF